jgi:protein TonB
MVPSAFEIFCINDNIPRIRYALNYFVSLEKQGMDFSQVERSPTKNVVGIAAVVAFHVLIIYALATGLARQVVEIIQQPIEMRIIAETKAPPLVKPTPPQPPKPHIATPQVPVVPRPEAPVKVPAEPRVTAAAEPVKPVPPDPAPPARPDPTPPAPVTAPPTVPPPTIRVAAVVDPNACDKPEYPRASLRAEETGTVTLDLLIGIDGRVVDSKVSKTSGFKDLDRAARAALSLCKFKPGSIDGKPEQSWTKMQYVWKLEG